MIGIDPDLSRIMLAKSKFSSFKNLEFIACKSVHFPLPENGEGYDLVTCNVVLHWIPTQEKVITFNRIRASLKCDGLFIGNISLKASKNLMLLVSLLTEDEQREIANGYYRETPVILKSMLLNSGLYLIEYSYRFKELNMGSLDNFMNWVTALYKGKYNFKAAYEARSFDIEFETYPNGDLRHTSEGLSFVAKNAMVPIKDPFY